MRIHAPYALPYMPRGLPINGAWLGNRFTLVLQSNLRSLLSAPLCLRHISLRSLTYFQLFLSHNA